MPAQIFERVADKLGLPPERSEKLVRAMIREIRKRAEKGQGVRVPGLGSFTVENGRLTFTPEPSLARSVNQRFEGLAEETVALPEVEESAQTGEGPTTITRGFDMGAWDPLDTGGGSPSSGQSQTTNGGPDTNEFDAPPDTDEFEAPPDTDEFQAPPDTSEFDAPDTGAFDAAEDAEDQATDEPSSTVSDDADDGDSIRTSWDIGSARPMSSPAAQSSASDSSAPETARDTDTSTREDVGATDSGDDDTFSPARLRGEEPGDVDEPEIDTSAPLEVADHRESTADDDPYDGSGFRTADDTADDDDDDEPSWDRPEKDASTSSTTGDTSDDDDDDEPNVWSSESVWDFSTVTSEDVEEDDDDTFDFDDDDAESVSEASDQPREEEDEPEYASYRPPDADEQAAEERPSRSIFDFDGEEEEPKKEAPKTTKLDATEIQNLDKEKKRKQQPADEKSGSRSAATTVTVAVLVILALIGGWIVLGQQGIVPPPSRTLGFADGLTEPADPSATDADTPGSSADATGESSSSGPAATPGATRDGSSSDEGEAQSGESSGNANDTGSSGRGFNASEGGFTIAVASRESESEARALVEQFRRNLSDTNLRIDLVVGESGGTTRYRVGVGQFPTRAEATDMRNEMQSRLPNGAWPVPIN